MLYAKGLVSARRGTTHVDGIAYHSVTRGSPRPIVQTSPNDVSFRDGFMDIFSLSATSRGEVYIAGIRRGTTRTELRGVGKRAYSEQAYQFKFPPMGRVLDWGSVTPAERSPLDQFGGVSQFRVDASGKVVVLHSGGHAALVRDGSITLLNDSESWAERVALSADGGTAAFVSRRRSQQEAPPKVVIYDVRSGRTIQVDWLQRLGAPK
ncbi:MAG: hypothetical protein IPK81_23270 [Rhodospirillales bacterium]|nr:MAG: hypothetical protein IPK81_23270 [Rhodospirillales bacterium]